MFARSRSGARGVTLALVGLLTATTLAPLPTLAQEAAPAGYYDVNGVWVDEAAAASTGYVDEAGNWVDTTAPAAESTGYVDASGNWVDTTGQAAPAAESTGYVDASGNWVDTTGQATAPAAESTGYVDASGNWVDTTGQAAPAAESTGYVDASGNWVDTTGQATAPAAESTGYVDASGNWVDTTGQAAAPAAEATGYVDASGNWVDTTGQAAAPAAESTGYVDASGNWVDTTGQAAAPAAESTGYVDASGNWVDTTGQATAVAPISGYYDVNGNWVEGTAVDPASQTEPVAQDNGYYDQNGVWVDNTASAAGNVIYNTSAGASNTTSAPAAAPIGTAYIAGTNGDGAICRTGADWNTPEIGTIPEGSAVEVTGGTVGEWQPVNCNGSSGYVHASFISWDQNAATLSATGDTTVVEAPRRNRNNRRGNNNNNNSGTTGSGNGQSMVNFASGFLGYPYVYAGAGPSGFDCSGFTMYVVQNTLGINIGHGVAGQYSAGTPVGKNSLQAGDLVFFENTFAPGLSHVGIYIGNGQFIHSENESTGVVISDLNSDYYASHYYGAVRLA